MSGPTPRQESMLRYIIRYKEANDGDSPTLREIRRALGLSMSTVYHHLNRLEEFGLIERGRDGQSRSIRVIGGRWVYEGSQP